MFLAHPLLPQVGLHHRAGRHVSTQIPAHAGVVVTLLSADHAPGQTQMAVGGVAVGTGTSVEILPVDQDVDADDTEGHQGVEKPLRNCAHRFFPSVCERKTLSIESGLCSSI